ncbi:MAG: hypothetical protein WBX03_14550 [Terriglobales bacterium]|jgi:hypothetical protein
MKSAFQFTAVAILWMLMMPVGQAQGRPAERTFPQSKPVVEAAVRQLQSSTGGHLPVLDGFAVPGEQPLDRFQRGYYQCTIQVTSTPGGGSLVRVSAQITAWYNSPVAGKSGYQVLPSNGRLESDLLDRLSDALGTKSPSTAPSSPNNRPPTLQGKDAAPSRNSAPAPDLPSAPSFKGGSFPHTDLSATPPPRSGAADRHTEDLDKEAKNLEEILRNQSHPDNLAAVRKSGTPVLISPSEGAKVLFLADAEDEFEILDSNESWVHVRISGLSRAWIRRSNLEMPDSSSSEEAPPEPSPAAPVADNKAPFQIENEQIASFPGDWGPLRGKVVRIVSIQKNAGSTADTGSQARLAFVKGLLDKEFAELTQTSSTAAGVVLIFDSADGGMVAATLPVLREWKAGTLSDEGLWRRCYLDPPEMFRAPGQ